MTIGNTRTASDDQAELLTPRFDEHASANAQPVTPIPKRWMELFFERTSQLFSGASSSLALIIVLGIATGTLIGMTLVREKRPSAPDGQDQASVLQAGEINEPLQTAEVGAYGIRPAAVTGRRATSSRSRISSNERPRAYRFAVVR